MIDFLVIGMALWLTNRFDSIVDATKEENIIYFYYCAHEISPLFFAKIKYSNKSNLTGCLIIMCW
jgi:hypothetical protein